MRNGILWMLHRVAPADSEHLIFGLDSSLRVSPDYLEMQIIRAKEQGARFLSIDEFLANKRDGTGRPTDVCITIDDGFKDIYDYAFPVFKRQNAPFVFYVASDFIDTGFEHCLKPEADGMQIMADVILKRDVLVLNGKKVYAGTAAEKQAAFSIFWQAFAAQKEKTPEKSGHEMLRAFFPDENLDFEGYRKRYLCSWNDLKEMAKDPLCTIGSHGKTHQWLSLMKDEDALEREFTESKKRIEENIGKEIFHFSYPYGQYNNSVLACAKKHYRSAVAIRAAGKTDRRFVLTSDDAYALPRISVQENAVLPLYLGTSALRPTYTGAEYAKRLFRKVFNFERKGRKRVLTVFFLKIKFKVKSSTE